MKKKITKKDFKKVVMGILKNFYDWENDKAHTIEFEKDEDGSMFAYVVQVESFAVIERRFFVMRPNRSQINVYTDYMDTDSERCMALDYDTYLKIYG